MPSGPSADQWLGACRRASRRIGRELAGMSPAVRREPLGHGAGGDTTIRADRMAENVVVEELTALGAGFTLISEEVGEVAVNGGHGPVVVVDPIDGSLNAGRGMTPFSTSIAVASGRRMGDVHLAYVHDHGTDEEFTAIRGEGPLVDGAPPPPVPAMEVTELILVEGALPRRIGGAGTALDGRALRMRAVGSLALSLCYVAAGRGDAMVGLSAGRAVDVAAAQLFALEAGLVVGMPRPGDLADAPLDVTTHRTVAAARDEALLAALLDALAPEDLEGP